MYDAAKDPNAFKPITENPIILDFSGCKYLGEIHLILKTARLCTKPSLQIVIL